MRRRCCLVAGVLLLGVVTGCSGSGSGPPTKSPSNTTSSAGSSAAAVTPVAVHFTSVGSGPRVLVLVHGGPGLPEPGLLTAFAPLTRLGYRVVYYDQRGVGASPTPSDGDYDPEAFIADLEALRVRLGVEKMDLLGHSWGGAVVALYTATYPDRVGTVVDLAGEPLDYGQSGAGIANFTDRLAALQREHLVPDPVPASPGTHCGKEIRSLAPVYAPDPRHLGRYATIGGPSLVCATDETSGLTGAAFEDDSTRVGALTRTLATWKGHAIVVIGTKDPFGTPWFTSDVAQFAAAQVIQLKIPDAGHFPWLDDPALATTIGRDLAGT